MIQNTRFYSGSLLVRFTANYKPESWVVKNLLFSLALHYFCRRMIRIVDIVK